MITTDRLFELALEQQWALAEQQMYRGLDMGLDAIQHEPREDSRLNDFHPYMQQLFYVVSTPEQAWQEVEYLHSLHLER